MGKLVEICQTTYKITCKSRIRKEGSTMLHKKQCVAMLLAGGQGSRLGVLTKNMAKPAVPFGGKYRIIDFPLSNCANSAIDTVGVLTQYRPLELNAYIGSGAPWDLDLNNGGVCVLPPYQTGASGEWYSGTANAIYQNLPFIENTGTAGEYFQQKRVGGRACKERNPSGSGCACLRIQCGIFTAG